MTTAGPLKIDAVLHKAFVAVDEVRRTGWFAVVVEIGRLDGDLHHLDLLVEAKEQVMNE